MERDIERQKTDEDIAWAAVFALEWDTAVPHHQITVEAEDGWLILEGKVEVDQHKLAAETAVSRLTGVIGVRNLIAVKAAVKP
jgi:osmotically-inducible protein OsmY